MLPEASAKPPALPLDESGTDLAAPWSHRMMETILLAEDNQDDSFIIRRAFDETEIAQRLVLVSDGEDVLRYLKGEPPFADRLKYPFPRLLVLDLKMPRMGGLEVLAWLQGRPEGKLLPVVILTESVYEPDIAASYQLGARTFINKPVSIEDLKAALKLAVEFCGGGPPVPNLPPFMPPPKPPA